MTSGLTSSSTFAHYLTVTDFCSRLFRVIGLKGITSQDVFEALKTWSSLYKPFADYKLHRHCSTVHVDAGSQFLSDEFGELLAQKLDVKLVAAAKEHQEMNGISERQWQSCRKMAFAMVNHARLGFSFVNAAMEYANLVMDSLPVKGCRHVYNGKWTQTCPGLLFWRHRRAMKVGNFRVFGSPAIVRVVRRFTPKTDESAAKALR